MSAIGAIGSFGSISGYVSLYQNRQSLPAGTQAVERVARGQTAPVPPEMAVRGRIRYLEGEELQNLTRSGDQLDRLTGEEAQEGGVSGTGEESKSPQQVMEEAECQTCKNRKYQDGSDDPGVSFKTATNIAPERAAAAVRGHEQEHVVREQAKARRRTRRSSKNPASRPSRNPPSRSGKYSGNLNMYFNRANSQQENCYDVYTVFYMN